MKEWPLNSNLIVYSTLYHLQQIHDGTIVQTKAFGYTSGGLRCNSIDYIRKGNPSKWGGGDKELKENR